MLKRTLFWLVTLIVMLIVIGPLLWIFLTAFKKSQRYFYDGADQALFLPPDPG